VPRDSKRFWLDKNNLKDISSTRRVKLAYEKLWENSLTSPQSLKFSEYNEEFQSIKILSSGLLFSQIVVVSLRGLSSEESQKMFFEAPLPRRV
jgi:hypothetical protein